MIKIKRRTFICICIQLAFTIITVYAACSMFFKAGTGNMQVRGPVIFRYFTVDSNLFCAVTMIVSAFLLFRRMSGREPSEKIVEAAMLFRYMGTVAVTVTMLTVMFFLVFLYGIKSMFGGWNFWLHLLGPVLAILSFVLLERDGGYPKKRQVLLSLLPVILYGAVYLVMVVVLGEENGGWPDFYGFNRTGKWYLSFIGMIIGTAIIGTVIRRLRFICRN